MNLKKRNGIGKRPKDGDPEKIWAEDWNELVERVEKLEKELLKK